MPDEGVWSAQDTTPAAIEAALRELLKEQHAKSEAYAPARVLNMVAVVDREWRGEIYNRLEGVGRYHASRTILCAVEPRRETIDAWVTVSATTEDPKPGELAKDAYVVDLAWLRSTPWRERIAATFDPAQWLEELGRLSSVAVRHRPDSAMAGVLVFGWLASRLGWEPGSLMQRNGELFGRASARRGDVELLLQPNPEQSAPGLSGITVETASGVSISLERGPGGLSAKRRSRDGGESSWTLLGASRGEAGILGEGIRQALLRDPTYAPAPECAAAMLG